MRLTTPIKSKIMNLGNTIKDLRKSKGIKQAQLAEECSITQSYLSNIEGNKKEPTLTTLQTICKHLGIPLPVVFFLAMDESDVSEEKRDLFKILTPMMKNSLRESFF